MPAVGHARERQSVKFYLVAMIFLLFDIEVLFLAQKLGARIVELPVSTTYRAESTFSVRNALGRVASGGRPAPAGAAEGNAALVAGDDDAGHGPVTASHLRQIASVAGLLVLWQLLVQTGKLSELFLPAPLSVLASIHVEGARVLEMHSPKLKWFTSDGFYPHP